MGEEIHVLLTCADDAANLGCLYKSSREEIECLEMKLEHVSQPCRVSAAAHITSVTNNTLLDIHSAPHLRAQHSDG